MKRSSVKNHLKSKFGWRLRIYTVKNQKSKRQKRSVSLPPLPERVTPEDIGRALVRQIKPVEKSETRESVKHSENKNE